MFGHFRAGVGQSKSSNRVDVLALPRRIGIDTPPQPPNIKDLFFIQGINVAKTYDAIVIGMGGMGSATAYHLARRGRTVLGLERYDIPHDRGSSHGLSRIIRLAYCEHPSYVPLLRRAFELWRELERVSSRQVLHVTGSLDIGPPDSEVVAGSLLSCRTHDIPHELLDAAEITRRFPGYQLPSGSFAVFQKDGGFLFPELCIVTHVQAAQAAGAEIRARERVLDWAPLGSGVQVRTESTTYVADRLVISAGAWVGKLVPELAVSAVPERQVLGWFQPFQPELFTPERFPVFNLASAEDRFYGLPIFGVPGFKVGKYHHLHEPLDPDHPDFDCYPRDEEVLREFVAQYFPQAAGPTMALRACIFTNTPDEHFILDALPECPQVLVASPCSGHGFKFCSVVGEIMADLVERGETRHDISLHRLARLRPPVPS